MLKRPRQLSNPITQRQDPHANNHSSERILQSGVHDSHPGKYTQLDCSANLGETQHIIKCNLPPHDPTGFHSVEDYEVHYRQQHVNRCSECGRNLPTDHFLSLHIAENHDPISATRRERGEKTYACFVEDCDKICSVPQKRRRHLIDKHMFPKDYDFFIVNDGLDQRMSMLRPDSAPKSRKAVLSRGPRMPSTHSEATGPKDDGSSVPFSPDESIKGAQDHIYHSTDQDMDLDGVTDSIAALKFVPSSISFGQRRQRGGFASS